MDPVKIHCGVHLIGSEARFLQLVCSELSYREIAKKMRISHRTIDTIRDRLFIKLRVKTRTGIVLWCIKTEYVLVKDIKLSRK